ncbi:hypothetical protein BH09MYX1_BH09MYX1_13880 [soil metagenome]
MRPIVILFVAASLAGCAHTAPLDRTKLAGGSDVETDIADVPVRGFETRVYTNDGETVDGELLDVSAKWVAIETEDGADLQIPVAQIARVRVTAYSNGVLTGALVAWSLMGTLSTLSHGYFLIFTAPVWVGAGVSSSITSAVESDQSVIAVAGAQADLWQFARFPQGIPASFKLRQRGTTAP